MQVKQVFENGDVLVSTRGYRRLVDQPGNRVSMEFVPASYADEVAAIFNDCFPDGSQWCEVWTYKEAANRGANCSTSKINRRKPSAGRANKPKGGKTRKTPRKLRVSKLRIAKVA